MTAAFAPFALSCPECGGRAFRVRSQVCHPAGHADPAPPGDADQPTTTRTYSCDGCGHGWSVTNPTAVSPGVN